MSDAIEEILKRQPLAQPTTNLDRRVLATLADPSQAVDPGADSRARSRWYIGALSWGLPAAAAVAIAFTIQFLQPAADPPVQIAAQMSVDAVEPYIQISQSWTESEPLDVLLVSESGTPLRAVRQQQLQQTQWVDPTDGVTIEIIAPVAEAQLVLQPANVY